MPKPRKDHPVKEAEPDRAVLRVLPSPVAPAEVQKAAEMIANHFRRDVATGKLRAGDALPSEGELLRHFDVSRPTLRSAFRILESESLLVITRGKQGGPRICHPGTDVVARHVSLLLQLRGARVGDLYHVRTVIEPPAAYLLAEHRPPAGIDALEGLIAEESEAFARSDFPAFTEVAMRFFRAVTDHCGNEILAVFGAVVSVLFPKPVTYIFTETKKGEPTTLADIARTTLVDHRKLLQLVQKGDAAAAERFWRRHVAWTVSTATEVQPHVALLPFTAFD